MSWGVESLAWIRVRRCSFVFKGEIWGSLG